MKTFDKVYEKICTIRKKAKSEQDAFAEVYAEFCKCEACGKCVPGREGTKQMLRILNKVCGLNAKSEDLATLEELAKLVEMTCRCKLCKTSVSPVLSTLHDYRNEYVDAVSNKQ